MQLLLARSSGPWQAWATLTLTERLPRDAADALHMSPANTGAGLNPVGWLQRLRPDSYAASAHGDAAHVQWHPPGSCASARRLPGNTAGTSLI